MAPQASPPTSRLPHQLTSFVGRATDLRALKDQLASARVVTLVGTGGVGKSRLAVELATAGESWWPDGVWWIELDSASDVAQSVVAALQLPGRGPSADVVSAWLRPRRSLLVLDNCEHLVADCAVLVETLLGRCPELTVLATSREPLQVEGEVRWSVGPLDESDAVRLFEARARLVAPGYNLSASNLAAVTQICRRLDRLPLAVEMAAAHLDVMSDREILDNLDDRLELLRSGTRGAPKRQQTMAQTIDWSYRLLTGDEARIFRRLAVFRGGFTLDAARAVAADREGGHVVEVLSSLVRKSMVFAERLDDGTTRYRLLESHHAFALDRLREAGEAEDILRRHHDFFARWLEAATHPQGKARETENVWSALDWARANAADAGLGLAVGLAEFDFSDHARIRKVLLELLEQRLPLSPAKAKATNLAARLVARHGDDALARSLADASVKQARALDQPELTAYVVRGAGLVHHTRGALDKAAAMYSEALELLEGSADEGLAIEVKNALGVLAVERGDHAAASALLTECVAYSRRRGDHLRLARYLESLANAQLALDDVDAAGASWTEALPMFRDLEDAFGAIWCLGGLALVAARRRDAQRALRLAAATDRVALEWSLTTSPFRREQLEAVVGRSRTALGEQRARSVWEEGQAMTLEQAVEYALGTAGVPVGPVAGASPLTGREMEVATMVAAGLTNKQIAERLFIAERTAEGHVERIRGKLGVRSRTEVATWVVSRGLDGPKLDKSTRPSTVTPREAPPPGRRRQR